MPLDSRRRERCVSFPFHHFAFCISHPTVRSSDHLFLLPTRSRSSRKPRWQSGAFLCPLYLALPPEVSLTSTLFDLGLACRYASVVAQKASGQAIEWAGGVGFTREVSPLALPFPFERNKRKRNPSLCPLIWLIADGHREVLARLQDRGYLRG